MAGLNEFDFVAFVEASCERSGVPVKVADSAVRSRVALLLSGRAVRGDAERLSDARPSDLPAEIDPVRIERRAPLVDRSDDSVVQHGLDVLSAALVDHRWAVWRRRT